MPFHLLFLGSPLLDVSVICESQYLEKYKLKTDDCILATEEHRGLFADVFRNPDSVYEAGGSAQNTARACKAILGENGVVSFAGCIGTDDVGVEMELKLKNGGVEPLYTKQPTLPTGICACLSSIKGERSMVTDLGAGATYNVTHLNSPKLYMAIQTAECIFIEGYLYSHSADIVKYIAKFCHRNNKTFALSLSAPYVCEVYANLLMECMPYIDMLFGNGEEAKIFLEKLRVDVTFRQPGFYAKTIADLPKAKESKRIVVITNGPDPVVTCQSGEEPEEFVIPHIDDFVESTGCGDALAGAFLADFCCAKSIKTAVDIGIVTALKVARHRGCVIGP